MLKIVKKSFFLIVLVLFIGCSDSTEPSVVDENIEIAENIESVYEYNSDETAVRTLSHGEVNIYAEVEANLKAVGDDIEAYNAILDKFMLLLMEDSQTLDTVSSFAPRGVDKSHIYQVTNDTLDYSDYVVRGDVTLDYKVDMEDIFALEDILHSQAQDLQYDVNGDDSIDILDFVDVVARLNTHIAYFDFYTTSGEKLPIEIRSIDDVKVIDISVEIGALITEDSVMVVAKDINKVSSYESGLSDIEEAWYNKDGWEYESSEVITVAPSASITRAEAFDGLDNIDSFVENSLNKVMSVTVTPYLIGWDLIINMSETGGFDVPLPTMDRFSLLTTSASADVRNHFLKADMGYPGVTDIEDNYFSYSIGLIQDGHNQINMERESFRYYYVRKVDGVIVDRIELYSVVTVGSLLYESEAENRLEGSIEGDTPFNGKIVLSRVGPDPKEEDFETLVNDNSFEYTALPLGEYTLAGETECGCKVNLDTNIILNSADSSVTVANPLEAAGKVYLNIVILDKDNQKIENTVVKIVSGTCSESEFTEEKTTDTNGNVEFTGLEIGSYIVYVEGKEQATFQVCSNTNEVITLEDILWKFTVVYSSEVGSGTMSVKNFPVNFEADDWHGELTWVDEDSIADDNVTMSFSGDLSYAGTGLNILGITPTCLGFNATLTVDGYPFWMTSLCPSSSGWNNMNGDLPSEWESNTKEGIATNWTRSDNGARYDVSFAPCQDSECSE